MSIIRMTEATAQRQRELDEPMAAAAAGDTGDKPTVGSAVQAITTYIPSEVISVYVALVGIIKPSTNQTAKWWIFGVSVALIPIVIALGAMIARRKALPVPSIGNLSLTALLAFVSFVAWAWAIPETPFLVYTPDATRWGGAAAVVLAAVLPKVADAFGLAPKN